MTPTEKSLNRNLRMLSENGPQEAPPHVERALRAAFLERVQKRRLTRWMEIGGAVLAVAAALAAVAIVRPPAPTSPPAPEKKIQARGPSNLVRSVGQGVKPLRHGPRAVTKRAVTKQATPDPPEFYALPGADATIPLERATVVRVQLPLSAFREVGLSVNEQSAAGQVQADVLLGQDGLARAVRFVQ